MSTARAGKQEREPRRTGRPPLRLVDEVPVDVLERPRLEAVDFDYAPPPRDPVTGRRTVVIRGQATAPRPRRAGASSYQVSARPDRVAMWAFLLGLLLVLMAVVTQG